MCCNDSYVISMLRHDLSVKSLFATSAMVPLPTPISPLTRTPKQLR